MACTETRDLPMFVGSRGPMSKFTSGFVRRPTAWDVTVGKPSGTAS